MTILPVRAQTIPVTRRPVLVGVFGLVGLAVIGFFLSDLVGIERAIQVIATLVVPGVVMTGFWIVARERMLAREAEFETALEMESVANLATVEFLAGVCHELVPHPEQCNLRAEALAVAVDYRNIRPDLKVAVPDTIVVTDPLILRQVLHILVGNAVRHDGGRVAIWVTEDNDGSRLNVSDDGPGLPPELGAQVFERYVDLAVRDRVSRSAGDSLPLARILTELIGGRMVYKRDPNWTHFSVVLPAQVARSPLDRHHVPIKAGVH